MEQVNSVAVHKVSDDTGQLAKLRRDTLLFTKGQFSRFANNPSQIRKAAISMSALPWCRQLRVTSEFPVILPQCR